MAGHQEGSKEWNHTIQATVNIASPRKTWANMQLQLQRQEQTKSTQRKADKLYKKQSIPPALLHKKPGRSKTHSSTNRANILPTPIISSEILNNSTGLLHGKSVVSTQSTGKA